MSTNCMPSIGSVWELVRLSDSHEAGLGRHEAPLAVIVGNIYAETSNGIEVVAYRAAKVSLDQTMVADGDILVPSPISSVIQTWNTFPVVVGLLGRYLWHYGIDWGAFLVGATKAIGFKPTSSLVAYESDGDPKIIQHRVVEIERVFGYVKEALKALGGGDSA